MKLRSGPISSAETVATSSGVAAGGSRHVHARVAIVNALRLQRNACEERPIVGVGRKLAVLRLEDLTVPAIIERPLEGG